jgi:lipid II isoglutaminyl synthase (glutamine-hydrolysing)
MRLPDARLAAAVVAAKGAYRATQLLGRSGGTAAPGLVGERVDPRLIGKLAARLAEGAVVVAGTNGKTTTARMLAAILAAAGKRVLNNGAGSNLSRGIAASFARDASLLGGPAAVIAVIETDEAAFPGIVAALRPRLIVLNNLFRDQLDRYGELNSIATKWGAALAALDAGATLVYDADDPTLCALAGMARPGTTLVSFGLGAHDYTLPELAHAADAVLCRQCGVALAYHTLSVGHLGDWYCPTGDNARPPLAYTAEQIHLSGVDGASLVVRDDRGEAFAVDVRLPGLYNVYNVLGATAAARSLGLPAETIRTALRDFVAPFGRIERVDLRGRRLTLALIKNPTGANEVLRLFRSAPPNGHPPAPLLICINDLVADGRDVSWLWDTDFEALADYPAPIVVSGIRALDMAVRLKYAGVRPDQITVVPSIADALIAVAEQAEPGADAYVLPTYTAMLAAREALHDQGALRDVWATAERR